MRINIQRVRRGFTLIELTLGLTIGIATATMVLSLSNQQLAFLKLFKAQNFLTDEAPIISMYTSRLIGKADRFRLHDSLADALAGKNPRLTASPVVVLNFRQPDGSQRATILSFENLGAGPALNYYVVPVTGVLGAPQWSITKSPTTSNVSFAMSQGILRMTLDGPLDPKNPQYLPERITYSGTMQQ